MSFMQQYLADRLEAEPFPKEPLMPRPTRSPRDVGQPDLGF